MSCDVPHQILGSTVDPQTETSYDIYYVLVPGYKYTFETSGQWSFTDAESNILIVGAGTYGGDMEFLPHGYYHSDPTNYDNTFRSNEAIKVEDVIFHNMDYNHRYIPGTNYYTFPAVSDNAGFIIKLYNNTSKPILIRARYNGHRVKWSSLTTLAYYGYHDHCKLQVITDMDDEVLLLNYSGYHNKYELMKYLNAYWDSLTMFEDTDTWNVENELMPIYKTYANPLP